MAQHYEKMEKQAGPGLNFVEQLALKLVAEDKAYKEN
jgi:hypothetical protein